MIRTLILALALSFGSLIAAEIFVMDIEWE